MSKEINIGLFGFGCVGQGLYDVLGNSTGIQTSIKKICIKHSNKKRSINENIFTTDKWLLLNDPHINTIVELIDDSSEAYEIVTTALRNKKNVVTANKKLIANHLEELLQLQKENNVSLIYEASACGGIPIIRTLEEYYDNEELTSVSGIFNGSSNFILTKIYQEHLSYADALLQAQKLGFAETDPTLDVEGFDPKFKLIILALHAFGIILQPSDVFNAGINEISQIEIELFKETGVVAKLNPVLRRTADGKIIAFVLPQLISPQHHLYNIHNEYNAVIVEGKFSNEQLFIGKGAGGHPTGSAVLSDISALSYEYKYAYKKYYQESKLEQDNSFEIPLYIRGNLKALNSLFSANDIHEVNHEGFVLSKKSLQWLIEKGNYLRENHLFVAQVHPESLPLIKTWSRRFEPSHSAVS